MMTIESNPMPNPQANKTITSVLIDIFPSHIPHDPTQYCAERGESRKLFCPVEEANAAIHQLLEEAVAETEKAFGGCKKCYGKGYATVFEYWAGSGKTWPKHNGNIKFCTCDRGEQLQANLDKGGSDG